MEIIVTGRNGQLGTALSSISGQYSDYKWIFLGREDLDITDAAKVDVFFNKGYRTNSVIINCAAYTDVEKAEDEPEKTYLVNRDGAKNLAAVSLTSGFKLIHISTDFVFSGLKGSPYCEDDKPDPLSIYGKSKYAGELEILKVPENCLIIRTSWLYSITHNTFLRKIYNRIKEGKPFSVVLDETGSPTNAEDLASAIMNIIEVMNSKKNFPTQIFHFCNSGAVTRFDYAKKIAEFSKIEVEILPITSEGLSMKAQRPRNSSLACREVSEKFGLKIRSWGIALKEAVGKMNAN